MISGQIPRGGQLLRWEEISVELEMRRMRQGWSPVRVITVGQGMCRSTSWLTDPIRNRVTAPRPWLPTPSNWGVGSELDECLRGGIVGLEDLVHGQVGVAVGQAGHRLR